MQSKASWWHTTTGGALSQHKRERERAFKSKSWRECGRSGTTDGWECALRYFSSHRHRHHWRRLLFEFAAALFSAHIQQMRIFVPSRPQSQSQELAQVATELGKNLFTWTTVIYRCIFFTAKRKKNTEMPTSFVNISHLLWLFFVVNKTSCAISVCVCLCVWVYGETTYSESELDSF